MNAMPLMRNLIFAAVLLAVGAFAYGLGRRHATSKSGGMTQVATISPQEKKGVEAAERGKDQEPNHASGNTGSPSSISMPIEQPPNQYGGIVDL